MNKPAKYIAALVAYLGFLPLFLLPSAALLPDNPSPGYLLPLLASLLALAVSFIPGKRRKWGLLLSILLLSALGAWMVYPINPLALLLLLPSLLMLLMFLKALGRSQYMIWPVNDLVKGFALHLAGQVMIRFPTYAPAGEMLSLFFSLYLIICLFLTNRYTLMNTMGTQGAPPARLLAQNRFILSFIAIFALILGNLSFFKRCLDLIGSLLLNALGRFLLWLAQLFTLASTSSSDGGESGLDLSALGEAGEPSAFLAILEKILLGAGAIIACGLILWGLCFLFKKLKKLLAILMEKLRAYSLAIGQDYVDYTESLMELSKTIETAKEKWRAFTTRRPKPPKWETLSPREKVRFTYAQWAKGTAPNLTAREALQNNNTAAIYEKARYSEHEISETEAENFSVLKKGPSPFQMK